MDTQIASNKPKRKRNIVIKIICVILAFLLTLGMDFIVANIVHKNNPLPASAEIKNGLSAYELAVEQGYTESLESWLKSLNGKSAYEIAVENGYTGTEAEWNKAVANVSDQNSASITNAEFSSKGELIITLSDGTTINVGTVAGADGKDGANGKNGTNGVDGKNGANGVNGTNGIDGKDGINGINGVNGKDGQDGIGISSASINETGQLILTFSDGSAVNLDKIVGTDGKDGRDGVDGAKGDKGDKGDPGADGKDGIDGTDGIGISSIVITEDGELDITLSNGTTLNLGTIKGADGKDGRDGRDGIDGVNGTDGKDGLNGTDGKDGQDGIGISNVNINAEGELVLTFSDNQTINLGRIVGKDGRDGTNGVDGAKGDKGDKGDTGEKGADGIDGKDGIGIKNVTVSDDGVLTVTLDNDTVFNLGNIKGADGKNGADGKDGDDGLSAFEIAKKYGKTNAATEEEWLEEFKAELKGEKGDTGAQGEKGKDGRGIAKTEIVNGELIITYTDGDTDNLGSISGSDMSNNILEFILLDDDTYGVKAGGAAKNCKTIEIPEMHNEKEVTQILSNGFSSLTSLTSISIPQTITTIGDLAFYNCPALESISLPNSLQKIGRMSFSNCYLITSVTIPQSVKYIGKYAFYQSGILQVTFEETDNWLCGGASLEYNYTTKNASGSTSISTRTYSLSDVNNAAKALRGPVEIAVGYNQFTSLGGYSYIIYNYSEQNWFELDWTHD